MKFIAATFLVSLCASVFAQDSGKFEDIKQRRLTNIESRMANLQELKSCVSSSTSKETMKACDAAHKTKNQSMKSANKSWREGKKAEWKSKKKK